jgi:hypothetical protein
MRQPVGPPLDKRRTPEFLSELRERARAWIPAWDLSEDKRDFGHALLEIAARFSSEVAERFDRGAEKMQRGFFDWLAVRGKAAIPARMPVVFRLADTARVAQLAPKAVRMQADANGTPVAFETETELNIVPGRLANVVAVDADNDALYLPWPGLSDLQPLEPMPTQWLLKNFASAGSSTLQLDPELGLTPGVILEVAGRHYRVETVDKDLVTIQPPLEADVATATAVTSVSSFAPFDGVARNWQQHALYFGDDELLNIEAEATIEVIGSPRLRSGVIWEYWGKSENSDEAAWRLLPVDANQPDAIVLLKPKGAMEQQEIGGKKGRWIRAYLKTVGPGVAPITTEAFSLRINASQCAGQKCPPDIATPSPKAEAMANTTPLVLDNVFLPLGREPRLFDAFYLASPEAFSKKGAHVSLCFEVGDTTFSTLAMPIGVTNATAGVGRDESLHIFKFDPAAGKCSRYANRDALRPPTPVDSTPGPALAGNVRLNPHCRPMIVTESPGFAIKTAAERAIWIWHERTDPKFSGWEKMELPPAAPTRIDDIVPVSSASTIVLAESQLWVHSAPNWNNVPTRVLPATDVTLVALAPVWQGTNGALTAGNQMVGVSDDKRLYLVSQSGVCELLKLEFSGTEEFVDADPQSARKTGGIRPAAFQDAFGKLDVVTANDGRDALVAYARPGAKSYRIDLPTHVNENGVTETDKVIGPTIDISIVNGGPQFAALCRRPDGSTYVAFWQPLDSADLRKIFFQPPAPAAGRLNGAPVTLPNHMLAPGTRGELFVSSFDPTQRLTPTAQTNREGVVLPVTDPLYEKDDEVSVVIKSGTTVDRVHRKIEDPRTLVGDPELLYELDAEIGSELEDDIELLMYRRSMPTPLEGDIVDSETITLKATPTAKQGDVLMIKVGADIDLYLIIDSDNFPTVKVFPDFPSTPAKADYWIPEPVDGRVAPIIELTSGNWSAALLARTRFYCPTADSIVRSAKAFTPFGTLPLVVALSAPWTNAPANNDLYVIDSTLSEWLPALADTSSSPELSWEYSNGTSWASLPLLEESTGHLKSTGVVRFKVPDDLAAVDWAGKTNHWIRARLISGDYGKEEVTVFTDITVTPQKQTIERSTENIRPPSVIKLHISYGFCADIQPAYLITEDSRSIRDQSDANRSPGASVEAFVSLDVLLGRLEAGPSSGADPNDRQHDCSHDCGCEDCQTKPPGGCKSPATSSPKPLPAPSAKVRRAVFVGLTRPPSGAPVNLLCLADPERDHAAMAPLSVTAYVRDRLVPIVADDATRALGESGLIKLTFSEPPTLRELFGDARAWLRVTPSRGVTQWKPSLRGTYLNGIWASATETLTRELLGSSEGAPKMTFKLARPPLLEGTLELRVKEPLGEEELLQLRAQDPNSVLSDVDELPGHWVLWRQVTDPGDRLPAERVYALDEAKGEILFGDGLHGAIPPIGVDSIVAFSYQRTEAGAEAEETVPGNLVGPRTPLNLVTPVDGAESVIAADQAAGGAPPETPERVLRFGLTRLRHRDRAVSLHDIEDLAMQSSPDVAQARVFARPDHVQMIVVMRGSNPVPNAAQMRELRRGLLNVAPITLSAAGALKVAPPRLRRLRIDLELRVSSLDHAGALTKEVRKQLGVFFDTVAGGARQDGWPLGANPREEDVVYALIDIPFLQSVVTVKFLEIGRDGKELPWPDAIKPTDLVVLDVDPVRIHLQPTEVAA